MSALDGTPLEGLNATALHIIRRLVNGQKVEGRWGLSHGSSVSAAFHEVEERGLIERQPTPKGRKTYVVLTNKARATIDALKAYDREQSTENASLQAERDKRDRIERAAPQMYELLKRWYQGRTDGFYDDVAAVLREIDADA
jgi:DNA-binding MarR family transcriptional regulator